MTSQRRKALAESWRKKCTCFCSGVDEPVMLSEAKHLYLWLCLAGKNDPGFFASLRMTLMRNAGRLSITTLFALVTATHAQTLMPTPAPSPSASQEEETIVPTFETQKLARTFMLDIPAPRGQITDRNGVPLAQNRLSYNLVITFPTPLNFSDAQTLSYTREKIDEAGKLIGRRFRISDEAILRHYRNRGIMPFEIAPNLTPQEYDGVK